MYYLAEMCFLCLKKNTKLQSVLIQDNDGIAVNEKLRCLFPELIDSTPDAHKLACWECLEKLRIPYEFKQSINTIVFRDYIDKLQCQHKSHQQLQVILTRLKSQTILAFTKDLTDKNVETGDEKQATNSLKIKEENVNVTHDQSHQLSTNENDAFFIKFNNETKETNLKTETENIETVDPLTEEIQVKADPFVDDDFSTNDQPCDLTDTNVETEDMEQVIPLPEVIYIKQEPFVDDDFTSNYSDKESKESEDIFKCKICDLGFSSPIYLENHTGRCNKTQKLKRKSPQKIKQDIVSSNNINSSYKCHKCDKMYTVKSLYERHLRNCKKQKSNSTKIAECTSTSSGSEHNDQSKQKKRFYKCNECNKAFHYPSLLEIHQRVHSGEKPCQCHTCHKIFTNAFDLNKHKLTHSEEKPHQCDICNKTFNQKGHLMRHKFTHSNIRPYQCSVCNKTFKQSSHLSTHMRLHTGETPYQCHICQFKTSDSGNLTNHIRTHTGEKPYQCSMCTKSFTESGNLNRHMRIHTGEKPYQCHICQFKCAYYGTLKSHIYTHTSEKPYQCEYCKKYFTTSSHLNVHLRKLHTDTPDS